MISIDPNEHIEIEGEIIDTTEKAVQIDFGYDPQWVPRSLILDGQSIKQFSDQTDFWIEFWFLKQEGLI